MKYFSRNLNKVSKFSVSLTMSYEVSAEQNGQNGDRNLETKDNDKSIEEKNKNEIIAGLQQLREQQRNIVLEIARIEDDKREHE